MVVQATRHDEVAQVALPELVRHLTEVVGAPLVAVMAQAPSARDVEHWAHGDKTPDAADERRLRDADWVVQTLLQTESAEVVKAWLMGMNPMLDDQAPGLILADDPESVFFAARAYRHGQMGA
jgi:hypothetical protein